MTRPPGEPILIEPVTASPNATVVVPGSKSITNRALVTAALAEGTSALSGALMADDTEAMTGALRRLGATIEEARSGTELRVRGVAGRLTPGPLAVDARESGTTARFLAAVLATGVEGPYRLDAAPQMRARPMGPLLDALRTAGAVLYEGDEGDLPLDVVEGGTGGRVDLGGDVSSQFLSALLLAGPLFAQGIRIDLTSPLISRPYVEMTASVMASFGITVLDEGDRFSVEPGSYRASEAYAIEPDASSASYFFAAAVITGGRVTVPGLRRTGLQGDVAFVDVLERMGAGVTESARGLTVSAGRELRGVEADFSDISDTAMTLAAVAPFASTPTRITGIGFIRRKESDRVAGMVNELRRCGVEATEEADGLVISPAVEVRPATVDVYADHRMAMSFALLGLRAPGIRISDPGCVGKTFPTYFELLDGLRRAPGR